MINKYICFLLTMSVCGVCKLRVERKHNTHKIECMQCKLLFHANCVKINPADIEFLNKASAAWKCPTCENLNRKLRLNSSPPLSPRSQPNTVNLISQPSIVDITSVSTVNNKLDNNSDLSSNLPLSDTILKKLNTIENQNVSLNNNIIKLNTEINSILVRVEKMQTSITNLTLNVEENNKKIIDLENQISVNNITHTKTLLESNNRIEFLEKQYLKNTIEIHGVPLIKNENLRDIVVQIINNSLDLNIMSDNIEHCFRKFGKKKLVNDKEKNNSIKNVAPIVVRFFSFYVKSIVINKKYEKKPIIKSNTFFPDSNFIIYINECLTFNNKKLFYEAKKIKNEKKIKYLWVRNNKIMVRIMDGDDIIYLNSLSDINNLNLRIQNEH